jgi:bifunctional non-homologous end joining protein LigD
VENAIIDGEIVCLDDQGISQFNWLLNQKHHAVLYGFDLRWLDGVDIRSLPLIARKSWLAELI